MMSEFLEYHEIGGFRHLIRGVLCEGFTNFVGGDI